MYVAEHLPGSKPTLHKKLAPKESATQLPNPNTTLHQHKQNARTSASFPTPPIHQETGMPHHHGALPEEAPSPRSSASGCYAFLRSASRRGGYRRLDSALAAVRVEVGTRERSVFHVDPAVLEAEPVRRLLAAAGRRTPGGAVAVAVDAMLFEHLLWLATGNEALDDSAADLSEIVEFYSQDDDDDDRF